MTPKRRITDKERLDWLGKIKPCVSFSQDGAQVRIFHPWRKGQIIGPDETIIGRAGIRATIDAAIRASKRHNEKGR